MDPSTDRVKSARLLSPSTVAIVVSPFTPTDIVAKSAELAEENILMSAPAPFSAVIRTPSFVVASVATMFKPTFVFVPSVLAESTAISNPVMVTVEEPLFVAASFRSMTRPVKD